MIVGFERVILDLAKRGDEMQTATGRRPRVGPYEPIETAYSGSFSVVYRCRDEEGQTVAVKAVRPGCSDPGFARRQALREARVRSLVRHPHALELLRVVPDADGPLLVGPWLEGGSLREAAGSQRLPLEQVLELAEGLGGALDELHAAGWWHGDVSPGNVLFDATGSPVLVDFGSARRVGARAVRRGTLVATPQVCAPEVWAGLPADGRADLYSLGVLLYRSLTGAWPFDANDPAALAELHLRATVPRPSPHVGPAVELILLRTLAKTPGERFTTGAELADALRDAARGDGPQTAPDADPVAAAAEGLERFAATLSEREQAALRVMLRRSAAAEAEAWHETEQIAMQVFAPAAALLALEDCGAATALASESETPAEVAAACGAHEVAVAHLLEFLAAAGLLAREGDRYHLPPGPERLYAAQAHTGNPVSPLREAAAFWGHLSEWSATGSSLPEMDRPDGALYARAAARTRMLALEPARELAETLVGRGLVPAHARVLDVGAGSAVWGLAVAEAGADVRLTALDRPLVLDVARANADAAGLGERFRTLAGNWAEVPLPGKVFDLAVLANVCHLESSERVRHLLRRVHGALRPGGTIVVVDTMPGPDAADAGALLQTLHLALRTPSGAVHDAAGYTAWLEEAGFRTAEQIGLRSAVSLSAMVASRG